MRAEPAQAELIVRFFEDVYRQFLVYVYLYSLAYFLLDFLFWSFAGLSMTAGCPGAATALCWRQVCCQTWRRGSPGIARYLLDVPADLWNWLVAAATVFFYLVLRERGALLLPRRH